MHRKETTRLPCYIYSGKNGKFILYEDENVNYNYEKGNYMLIPFIYNDTDKTITIGDREGSYNGMPNNRKFKIVYITPENPVSLKTAEKPCKELIYNGKQQIIKLK